MAPTLDDVTALKGLVSQLQYRIDKIEKSMTGNDSTKTSADELRMILMGPPGAGLSSPLVSSSSCAACHTITAGQPSLIPSLLLGKGTQAPKIKEKFCVCHLVRTHVEKFEGVCADAQWCT